jgi:hypothetical protein
LELGAGCGVVGLGLATYHYDGPHGAVDTAAAAAGASAGADDDVGCREGGGRGVAPLVDHVIVTDQDVSWVTKSVNANPTWFATAPALTNSTAAVTPTNTSPTNEENDHNWWTVGGGLLTVQTLEWGGMKEKEKESSISTITSGSSSGSDSITTGHGRQRLDYIVGSDLLYNPDSYDDLLSTIHELASTRSSSLTLPLHDDKEEKGTGTQILLAYPERHMVVRPHEESNSRRGLDRGVDVPVVAKAMVQQRNDEDRATSSGGSSWSSRWTPNTVGSTTTASTTITSNTTDLFSNRVHAHGSFRIVSVQDLLRNKVGVVEHEEDSTKYTLMRLMVQQ